MKSTRVLCRLWDFKAASNITKKAIGTNQDKTNNCTPPRAPILDSKGIGHLDVCCQILPNCIEYAPSYLGTMFLEELRHAFLSSRCKAVITSSDLLEDVLAAAEGCPSIKVMICVTQRADDRLPQGVISWKEMRHFKMPILPTYKYSADDSALVQYACGISGPRKAVLMSHKNISTMLDITTESVRIFEEQ
ncbi:hypothetical protein TELCIR_06760 [Teladorsagia circumcincta]|uniref:Uncharacterized protein n=1 Tax=Teladorsagia circumcincta TaxID=45464 RepID=A0A2G9UNQ1_TELCI|nr:hypothetical protein TELCIR_06760 [Teladorsagia circumcincta]